MKIFNRDINYDWIKENIGMSVLIPTLLGGLWQLEELSRLGTPFIRFFSVSQLVADGLLILFLLSLCGLGLWVVGRTQPRLLSELLSINSENAEGDPDTNKPFLSKEPDVTKQQKGFGYFFFFLALLFFYYIFVRHGWREQFSPVMPGDRVRPANILSFFMNICITAIFLGSLVQNILTIAGRRVNYKNKYFQSSRHLFLGLIVVGVLFCIIKLPSFLRRSFLMPELLKNNEYVGEQVKRNNPKLKSWEIAYFNDKFVFISIADSSCKKYIEVMEFDAMFSAGKEK